MIIFHRKKKIKAYLSRDEIKYNNLLREKERNIINRLYLSEKKKFMKKAKINFKSFFSVDNLNNDNRENLVKNPKSFLINQSKEKDNSNPFLTNKNIVYRNGYFNNQTSFSENKEKKAKSKPKIIIDAKINNKIREGSKKILHPENQEQEDSIDKKNKNFLTDIEKLKNYQFRIKPLNKRKLKGFHLVNSLSTGK